MIQVMIISPVLAVRAGLNALLNPPVPSTSQDEVDYSGGPQIEVIGEFAGLPEVGTAIKRHADVLVVTDDALLEDEIGLLAEDVGDRLAVLHLGEFQDTALRNPLEKFRAWGFLPLDSSVSELTAAIQALHEGLIVATPELITSLIEGPPDREQRGVPDTLESLTERETQVLELIATGQANKQIAISLDISEHTVKFHVSSIFSKIGANNRAEAVRKAIQQGLISL